MSLQSPGEAKENHETPRKYNRFQPRFETVYISNTYVECSTYITREHSVDETVLQL
jgi:hypothetical protein